MDIEEIIKWLKIMKANLNTFPEVSSEKKLEALAEAIRLLKNEQSETPTGSDDCISRADALRVAKNEYLRGYHNALCKALSEKYSIHCEEGNFSVIQEETITGLGLSMNCALGKDVESYMSTMPSVTPIRPKGYWIDHSDEGYVECPKCGSATNCDGNINDLHFCFSCGAEMEEVKE